MFWPGSGTWYRDRFDCWPAFIRDFLQNRKVTDLVLFGDCRPYHATAIAAARASGVALHLFEEGYLRPNWITLEHVGVNDLSDVPRQPSAILAARAVSGPEPRGRAAPDFFRNRAAWDVLWASATTMFSALFPHYQRHTLLHPLAEYPGWIRRWFLRNVMARRDAAAPALLEAADYFVFPLQLDGDFQMRVHSRFRSCIEAAEEVVSSFANNAPPGTLLVIKRHPFDVGPGDKRGSILDLAARHGMKNRIVFIEGGDVAPLLARACGVIVINSTSALVALSLGKPLIVLGRATYKIEGLAHGGQLDGFWRQPKPPDQELWLAYRHVLLARTQVNGGFFSREGIDLAVAACVTRMLEAGSTSDAFQSANLAASPG